MGGLVLHPQLWSNPSLLYDWKCECYIWHLFSKDSWTVVLSFKYTKQDSILAFMGAEAELSSGEGHWTASLYSEGPDYPLCSLPSDLSSLLTDL